MGRKKKTAEITQKPSTNITWGAFKRFVEQNTDVNDQTPIQGIDLYNATDKNISVEVDPEYGLFIEEDF